MRRPVQITLEFLKMIDKKTHQNILSVPSFLVLLEISTTSSVSHNNRQSTLMSASVCQFVSVTYSIGTHRQATGHRFETT